MTDEELLLWLRVEDTNLTDLAAARIEALIAGRDTMGNLWAKEKERSRRLQDGLLEAIRLAERPHYGDRGDALDHCFEAIDVLRATIAEIKGKSHE